MPRRTESRSRSRADESPVERAKRLALGRLSRRPLSRAELVEWLAARGCDEADALAAAEELARLGLLGDARLAEALAREAERKGPRARRAVESKLARRSLDPGDAAAVLDERFAGRSALEDAIRLAESTARRTSAALGPAARARRIHAALARAGYDEETCSEAVQRVLRLAAPD